MRRLWVALVLVLLTQEAAALFGGSRRCDPTDNDAAEASRVIGEMTSQLTALEHAIVEALRLHAAQVSAVITQSANAFGQAMDGANMARVEMLRDVEESRAIRDHSPSETVCEGITGMSGLGPGRAAQTAAAEERAEQLVGRLTLDPTVVTVTAEAGDTRARFERLVQLYCDPARAMGAEGTCTGSAERHGADLHPGALLGHATLIDGVSRDTATDWMRNIAVPVAWERMPYRDPGTTPLRRRMLRERAFDARAALAGGFLGHLYAQRVPAVNLGRWAREVLPPGAGPPGEALSHHALLEALTHRFESPDYFLKLQAQGEANLLRELVQLRAVDLLLDWERYRLAEYQGAMSAALLALETERDRVAARAPAQ
ncbi:MAG: hypothetical protein OXU81_15415 [Gammaproteobacteria bacterium]|nr:hypothetical protein [Gammaproteobacteria bacterium]